jgi:hypothetical protein
MRRHLETYAPRRELFFCWNANCPESSGTMGFLTETDMQRHLVTHAPGYTCPFCTVAGEYSHTQTISRGKHSPIKKMGAIDTKAIQQTRWRIPFGNKPGPPVTYFDHRSWSTAATGVGELWKVWPDHELLSERTSTLSINPQVLSAQLQ